MTPQEAMSELGVFHTVAFIVAAERYNKAVGAYWAEHGIEHSDDNCRAVEVGDFGYCTCSENREIDGADAGFIRKADSLKKQLLEFTGQPFCKLWDEYERIRTDNKEVGGV